MLLRLASLVVVLAALGCTDDPKPTEAPKNVEVKAVIADAPTPPAPPTPAADAPPAPPAPPPPAPPPPAPEKGGGW